MKYHTFFFLKLGKMLQNLSSAAVVIGALRVKADQNPLAAKNSLRLIMSLHKYIVWLANNK